jgi:hypothetical protein
MLPLTRLVIRVLPKFKQTTRRSKCSQGESKHVRPYFLDAVLPVPPCNDFALKNYDESIIAPFRRYCCLAGPCM